jgi:hypothetical protein
VAASKPAQDNTRQINNVNIAASDTFLINCGSTLALTADCVSGLFLCGITTSSMKRIYIVSFDGKDFLIIKTALIDLAI